MSEQQLAEIRARVAGATAGPWMADGAEIYRAPWGYVVIDQWVGEMLRIEDEAASNADAQFVAHARTDVPSLLAEIDRLRTQVATIRRALLGTTDGGEVEAGFEIPACEIARILDELSGGAA